MQKIQLLETKLNEIIEGKPEQVRLSLICLLSKGHLLLEDLPGSGKTTLAKSFASLIGMENKRIQFTADMLPADITGALIYNPQQQKFNLQKGPVFTNILLADEINRASPKCQSALLEAMEEGQVSIEGNTIAIEEPFFVIATQNPTEQYGTFPLPESQLDRFLFKVSMGYLDSASEINILLGKSRKEMLKDSSPVISKDELINYQNRIKDIHISRIVAEYVQLLLKETRECGRFVNGLSTRSGIALLNAAKSYAFLEGVDSVYPEYIQAIFVYVASHRLSVKGVSTTDKDTLIKDIMFGVSMPI